MTRRRWTGLLLAAVVATAATFAWHWWQAATQLPIVVMDGWWNADYAKNACANLGASCPTIDPVRDVRDFEDRVATEFASSGECKPVHYVQFRRYDNAPDDPRAGDAMAKPHWSLMIDYAPAATAQHWSLVGSKPGSAYATGIDEPLTIARKVCAIAAGQGATVQN